MAYRYTFPRGSWRLKACESEHTELARDAAPGLIVTGSRGAYRVTHKSSGYACSPLLGKLSTAKAAAARLATMLNWDRGLDEVEADIRTRGPQFARALRDASSTLAGKN